MPGDTTVSASASIGVCYFPTEVMDVDELLSCADKAMYQAKQDGKNSYFVYQSLSN